MSDVIVIGGGAAGMMAACAAAKNGHEVTLIEKNEKLGKKIYITGKGRCNVTNAGGTTAFFDQVVRNPKSLYSAVYSFDALQVMAFMEEYGCPLKVERGNRVFPVSDHASDVIRACARAMERYGVRVRLNTKAGRLLTEALSKSAQAGEKEQPPAGVVMEAGEKEQPPAGVVMEAGGGNPVLSESGDTDGKEWTPLSGTEGTGMRRQDAGRKKPGAADRRICGVRLADGECLSADAVVVATGGLSYPSTGSDGDGFQFAEELGLSVEPLRPALVPFTVREEWCKRLQGLALKNVAVLLESDGKTVYSGQGELLFTHFGVSGPLILSASSYYADACEKRKAKRFFGGRGGAHSQSAQNDVFSGESKPEKEKIAGMAFKPEKEMILSVDLKPALAEEVLDKRLLREFEENKNRYFKNAVESLFPAKLLPVMVELSGIAENKPVHDITRQERRQFVRLMKALPLTVTGTRGYAEAVITQGGVSVKEIDPSTMESKKIKGLYFAGEVVDVDALTGGYNLQIAWSTGHLAGESIPPQKEGMRLSVG